MKKGFTLSELLIALVILGLIATFTIPKVLQSQQSSSWNSGAKEAIAMMSGAYEVHKQNGLLVSTTEPVHLTPYMNYVAVYTDGRLVDEVPPYDSRACDVWKPCLQLHNGGILHLMNMNFDGTAATNSVWANYDPDGVYSGEPAGDKKSVSIRLMYNGKITTSGALIGTVTCSSWGGCWTHVAGEADPPWFSWN